MIKLGNDNYFSDNCCSCGRAKTLKELRQAENDQELQKISKKSLEKLFVKNFADFLQNCL